MGYYLRYIATDEQEITLSLLEHALKQSDKLYSIKNIQTTPREFGDLNYDNEIYAQIEINRPKDELFEEELEELKEFVEDEGGENKQIVLQVLKNAQAVIAVQVLWQDRNIEQTLDKIDLLWNWLFANRKGLLQADGEGYYDDNGLIFEVE